jgi:hypothetical protein
MSGFQMVWNSAARDYAKSDHLKPDLSGIQISTAKWFQMIPQVV